MKYLLDANTISYLDELKQPNLARKILKKARSVGLRNIYICIIGAGEVYAGIYFNPMMNSARKQNLIRFLSQANLLKMQRETSEIYGKLRIKLKDKGVHLSDNDVWIASTALTHNSVLVTDDKDFKAIEGLKVENWIR